MSGLLVALATVTRLVLDPFIGQEAAVYVPFFLASAIAMRFLGLGPSILNVILGGLAIDWFILPPRYTLSFERQQVLPFVFFIATNLIFLTLAQALRRETTRAEDHAKSLLESQERLELLSEAAANFLFTVEPASAIHRVFQRVQRMFQADAYVNFLVNDKGDGLWLHAYAGIPSEAAQSIARLEFGQAVGGSVAASRQPLHLTHIPSLDDPKAELVKSLGLRAYACFPLLVGDRLLGTFSFGSRTKDAFGEEELKTFSIFCSYLSIALDRWRLMEAARHHAENLEQRVAERTADLQQTVNSLQNVLYHIAHDLRAPLRAMSAFTQMLMQDYAPAFDAKGVDLTRRITQASATMDALIRDLLDYGRLGHQKVSWAAVDLNALLQRLAESFRDELAERQAQILIDKPLPTVWADAKLLEQILSNLLGNGLKFVAPGTPPRIHIWAEEFAGTICLSIQDNGIGIDPEYHQRIFGVFERLHEQEEYPGTGIGLAIAEKGIGLLKGEIKLESQVGQGACFVLKLQAGPRAKQL